MKMIVRMMAQDAGMGNAGGSEMGNSGSGKSTTGMNSDMDPTLDDDDMDDPLSGARGSGSTTTNGGMADTDDLTDDDEDDMDRTGNTSMGTSNRDDA